MHSVSTDVDSKADYPEDDLLVHKEAFCFLIIFIFLAILFRSNKNA